MPSATLTKLLTTEFVNLTEPERVALLEGIRSRRLTLRQQYEKVLAEKNSSRRDKLTAAHLRELERWRKKLEKVDDLITELENRHNKLVAIMLEIDAL